jgi:putative toxin-antitoxin system antitoxin component (TIGR02293 family)
MASEVLGSLAKARAWLHAENRALGGRSPIGLLDTEIGEQRVEDLLNRINYGIYS